MSISDENYEMNRYIELANALDNEGYDLDMGKAGVSPGYYVYVGDGKSIRFDINPPKVFKPYHVISGTHVDGKDYNLSEFLHHLREVRNS